MKELLKKIREWHDHHNFFILFVLLMFGFVYLGISAQKDTVIQCSAKCEELGFAYFDSEPQKFFGLKSEDCKCKNSKNELIDIK